MLLLHTSDWHLGRSLHRVDLREAQAAFLSALIENVRSAAVDVVVVAGDVYDRAIPPVEAVALFEEALSGIRAAGARVVVSSGNHDSATRLGFAARLVDVAGVHLRTRPAALAEPLILTDRHGPVGIYAVPYLEPEAVRTDLPLLAGAEVGRGHAGVLAHAARCISADAAARGLARTVVTAHAWVTGATACDSERDITVGGVSQVAAEIFTPFTYTALGHLHGPQVISENVRYCGSPLPYSFSEAGQQKGWWLVELGRCGVVAIEHVPAPVLRGLSLLRGELPELLTSRQHAPLEQDFLSVVLTDPQRPVEPMDRLRARFPHVLTVSWEPSGPAEVAISYASRLRGRDDLGVASAFVTHVRQVAPTADEGALLRAAWESVRRRGEEPLVAGGAGLAGGSPDRPGRLPAGAS